jgi:Double zinc ribbon
MASYKHPCKYCGKLIERDSNFCPFCAQENPLGPMRCPLCRNPVEDGAKICGHCGFSVWSVCKNCGKETFVGDNCKKCGALMTIVCPNPKCRIEQSPTNKKCIKCGELLR